MKKINELNVEVKYTASLLDVTVSKEVYNGLMKISENGETWDTEIIMLDDEVGIAWDWLCSNISESDAMGWSFEVDEIDE